MPADNTEEIKIKTGESAQVKLKGLATAGYEWNYIINDNKDLVSVSKDFILTEELTRKNIGKSADEIFTIKAHGKGTATITFFQQRSWEKKIPPVNEKKIKITIA